MSFKDMVAADNSGVFLRENEFAEKRNVEYDGVLYSDVLSVLTGLKEQQREKRFDDHAEGLFLVTSVFFCEASSLGGAAPEKGKKIYISDGEWMQPFRVETSVVEMHMLRLDLEELDE